MNEWDTPEYKARSERVQMIAADLAEQWVAHGVGQVMGRDPNGTAKKVREAHAANPNSADLLVRDFATARYMYLTAAAEIERLRGRISQMLEQKRT